MNLLKCLLIVLFFGLLSPAASGQAYESAVGLRFGYPLSVSYKTFIDRQAAIEGYVGFRGFSRYRALSLNGAYLLHNAIREAPGLQWYYGGGAGIQFWSYDEFNGSTTLGLSGYLGLEYVFDEAPISISLDWRPTIYIGRQRIAGFNAFGVGYGGFGVRYVLH